MLRKFLVLALFLSACRPTPAAQGVVLPLPEMVVSKAVVPPVIDGKISPGEWDRAPACTAFTVAFSGELCHIQSVAQITYDDRYLYVCMRNLRGPTYTLLSKRGRKPDDQAIVFDPSNEIWITPPVVPATTYQTLFNAYPAVFDCKMIPSVGYTAMSWKGNWEIASSETRQDWTIEARAPIKSFGMDAVTDGSLWHALFTTDVLGKDTGGFRAWAPGGGFAEINRHGALRFRENSPVFQLLDVQSIFTGKPAFPMAVTGPAKGSSDVTVTLRFGAGVQPAAGDLVQTRKLTVADGRRETFTLGGDLAALKAGFCEVTAKAGDGAVLYHQVFPFVVDGYVLKPPDQIQSSPYATPFGLEAFYAPLSKKLIVKIDRLYLPQRADAAAGVARLKDAAGRIVAERPVAPFRQDISEFPMDLAALQVPVQTEADWARWHAVSLENKQIAEENKKRKAAGQPEQPLKEEPGPKPAEYSLEVALNAQDGKTLATTTLPVKLMGYQFEWQNNTVGISDKVIPPWTPLQWKAGTLSLWNKQYQLNGLGLAERILNAGAPQLSGPMRLVAVVDGKEVPVKAGPPQMAKLTEAAADLKGSARLGDLDLEVSTHAEFDGFVLNTMRLNPRRPVKLDRLSLVVTMPRGEAPCFVTTSGGWSAYHGWTPVKWDSRETALGSMVGNFVPYVFLTDSERGFCWFADNEKGWILDPDAPTQELSRDNSTVTLRVNFVTRPGLVEKPTTLRYGWMVTPQKPQPKGWRAYTIEPWKPYAQATTVFWNDADWAVLWPYYSSPYPWDYDKSRKAMEPGLRAGMVPCVGNIAHAIARYRDYKDRWFNDLAADWGSTLGDLSNGNVARSRGPNDFQLWHWDQWVKKSNLSGLYFDENYLGEEWNYLTGGAYLLPDERIQPGYSYLGLREMDKRLRYMFAANGKTPPNLWLHTTSGQPVYAWMPDVGMEGENVEPTGLDNDYLECLPAGRLRAIGMGRNLGCAPFIMCQASRHWNDAYSPFVVPQFVGWVLAHDCLPEGVAFWPVLASEMGMWRDDIRFLPYWKTGWGAAPQSKEILVSAHARQGQAVLWVVNTAREDRTAVVQVDVPKLLGAGAGRVLAFDAETGEAVPLQAGKLTVPAPKRMWRAIRLFRPAVLKGNETFVAHFEGGDAAADECLGYGFPRTQGGRPIAPAEGKTGKGVTLDEAFSYPARMHVSREQGSISLQLGCDPAGVSGTLLAIGDFRVSLNRGKLQASLAGKALGEAPLPAGLGWHAVSVSWKGGELSISVDGAGVVNAVLPEGLPIPPAARGLQIAGPKAPRLAEITFGPVKGAVMDDLVMRR